MFSIKNTLKSLPVVAVGASLALTGCTQQPANQAAAQTAPVQDQAAALQATDAWAKAAENGMSAAFAVLENTSDADIALETVTEDTHGTTMEIHEMTGQGTDMRMQRMDEPLVIAAGSTVELAPGGNHIMYLDLATPLVASETSTLTLTFSDGSSTQVDFAIRNYDGANESYHPQSGEGGH